MAVAGFDHAAVHDDPNIRRGWKRLAIWTSGRSENPYATYARLRERDPIWCTSRDARRDGSPAVWVISSHSEVQMALRDSRLSSARLPRGDRPLGGAFGASMIAVDPPEHTRLRGLVSKAFTPRRIADLHARIVGIIDDLLLGVKAGSRFDLIEALAGPLPATVIAELLGVPREDQARFRAWSNELFDSGLGAADASELSASGPFSALVDYLDETIAARRKTPGDDLISGMIAAQIERKGLTDAELRSSSLLLLLAGFETTTNLIGNGMLALLEHPHELARLRAQPSLLPFAIDEMLRFDSPVQFLFRVATEDIELAGRRIAARSPVVLLIGAANRDPRAFSLPDEFRAGREKNQHLAFGAGIHHCLGAVLARFEARAAFEALLTRFSHWSLVDQTIERRPDPLLRGLARLEIQV